MKKYFLVVWLMVMVSGNASAGAVAGSLEVTQILNFMELVNQTDTVYEQWRVQYDRMQKLKVQMEKGTTIPLGKLKSVASDMTKLVNDTQGMGYKLSTITKQFDQLYPDFKGLTNTDFSGQYKKWSDVSKSSIKAALDVNGLQAERFADEAMVLAQLTAEANAANNGKGDGSSTVAMINAGNQIALAGVEETRKLRQIQLAQNVAQTTYMQKKKAEEDKAVADAGAMKQSMPQCAKRDINTRFYLNGKGCTWAELNAFEKQRSWK